MVVGPQKGYLILTITLLSFMVLGSMTSIILSCSLDKSNAFTLKLILIVIELLVAMIMVYFFIKTAFSDPGIIPRNKNTE